LGLATSLQAEPSQASIRVRLRLARYSPTALQELAETHDTPYRELKLVPLLGLATCLQALPFQDSMMV